MQSVLKKMSFVKWNVHVGINSVSVAYVKPIPLAHVQCGHSGLKNVRMNQKQLIGLQFIQNHVQSVTNQLRKTVAAI